VGYAQKAEATFEKMAENRVWKVSVRSKKDQHHVEAANVKDADGQLVFTDDHGNLVGSFCRKDVQGYSVESEAARVTVNRSRSKGNTTPPDLQERLEGARRRLAEHDARTAAAPVPEFAE
jgi:hypothetical protein